MALMGVKLLKKGKNEVPYLKSYRVRPQFIQTKRIIMLIVLLLFFTFLISINANTHLKADTAPTVRPKEPINSVAIKNDKTKNEISTKESNCQITNPKYGGYISKNCTETRYDKVIECFSSSEYLDNVNIDYYLIKYFQQINPITEIPNINNIIMHILIIVNYQTCKIDNLYCLFPIYILF